MGETFGNIEIIVRFIIFFQNFLFHSLSSSFSILIEYGGIEVFITQYCAGGKIEMNEMGRACGAYGER